VDRWLKIATTVVALDIAQVSKALIHTPTKALVYDCFIFERGSVSNTLRRSDLRSQWKVNTTISACKKAENATWNKKAQTRLSKISQACTHQEI
jgi:hypothetical protein